MLHPWRAFKKIHIFCAFLGLIASTGASCPPDAMLPPNFTVAPVSVNLPNGDVEVAGQSAAGTNLFAVDATVNGGGPFRFIVDTGAAISVVSSQLGNQLPDGGLTLTAAGIGGTTDSVSTVQINSLGIGNMTFQGFLAAVIDIPLFQGLQVDGIIGLPVFRSLTMRIDYPRKTLRVQNAVLGPDSCNVPFTGGDFEADGSFSVMTINVNVAGNNVPVIVDSGSDGFLGLPNTYSSLPFTGPLTNSTAAGVAGNENVQIGILNGNVIVGCHSYPNPQIDLGTSNISNLGSAGWQSMIFFVDQTSKLVRFQDPN